MFGISKKSFSPLQGGQEKFETIIGPQVQVLGHLRVKESVRIDGAVVGDIQAEAGQSVTVVIGATGQVQGNILADFVVVAGQVVGHIEARERVELHPHSRVEGTSATPRLPSSTVPRCMAYCCTSAIRPPRFSFCATRR